MEKKELKWYEAPIVEIVELEAKAALLAGSPTGGDTNIPGTGDGDLGDML